MPLAAAANEMMNACRGLGIDGNDFVVAHQRLSPRSAARSRRSRMPKELLILTTGGTFDKRYPEGQWVQEFTFPPSQ